MIGRVCGVWLIAAAVLSGASQDPTSPAASAPLVVLSAAVTDAAGTRVKRGLGPDDFDLTIDGVPTPIHSFSAQAQSLTSIVLIDVSASRFIDDVRNRYQSAIDQAFLARLAPDDRTRIGGFGRQLVFSGDFSSDRRTLSTAVRDALHLPADQRDGPSPIWDVLDDAVSAIETQTGRRAIVLFTDGNSTGNRLPLQTVIDRAALADVAVSIIGHGPETRLAAVGTNEGMPGHRAGVYLQAIAHQTGGLYFVDGLDDSWQRPKPAPFLEAIVDSMRATYLIGFQSPVADGSVHDIGLRAKDGSLRVHVRKKYRASSN